MTSGNSNHRFIFGDFTFETPTHSLRYRDTPIKLTPKNAAVLLVLLTNGPVSPKVLFAKVWPERIDYSSHSVHAAISSLRKALGGEDTILYVQPPEYHEKVYVLWVVPEVKELQSLPALPPQPPSTEPPHLHAAVDRSAILEGYTFRLGVLFFAPIGLTLVLPLMVVLSYRPPNPILLAVGCALSIAVAAYTLCRDYSRFLPTHYIYTIYYDEKGLRDAVELMRSSGEVFVKDWKPSRRKYFARIDQLVIESGEPTRNFFAGDISEVQSHGSAIHEVTYQRFWQHYRIVKIEGSVRHIRQVLGFEPTEMRSRYALKEASENHVTLTPRLLLNLSTVFRTTLKQSFSTRHHQVYDDAIICLTKTRILPSVGLNCSLFCVESEQGLVPIAYSKYDASGFAKAPNEQPKAAAVST